MAKIWIIRDGIIRRNRVGRKYMRAVVCIQHEDLILVGDRIQLADPIDHADIRLGWTERSILEVLMLSPHRVHKSDLVNEVYPDPEYEPENSSNCISQMMSKLRKHLALIGWGISTDYCFGYSLERISATQFQSKGADNGIGSECEGIDRKVMGGRR